MTIEITSFAIGLMRDALDYIVWTHVVMAVVFWTMLFLSGVIGSKRGRRELKEVATWPALGAWVIGELSWRFVSKPAWGWVREAAAWPALASWAAAAGLYLYLEYWAYERHGIWPMVDLPFWVILGSAGTLGLWAFWWGCVLSWRGSDSV